MDGSWRWFYQPVPVGAFSQILVDLGFGPQPSCSRPASAFRGLPRAVWRCSAFRCSSSSAGLKRSRAPYYEAAALDVPMRGARSRDHPAGWLRPEAKSSSLVVVRSIVFCDLARSTTLLWRWRPLDSTKPLVPRIYHTSPSAASEMGFPRRSPSAGVILMHLTLLQLRHAEVGG